MLDLKSIRVFLAVAEHLSFAKAARALHMTPATVTRTVSRLEADLGQQLFVRTTRQVSLTSAGASAVARLAPLIADFDTAERDLTSAVLPDAGRLRINAPLSLGLKVMPDVIDSFRLAFPRAAIDMQLTDSFVDIIADDCDLAIRVSGPPTDKSTIWRKLCEVPLYAVAAPSLVETFAPIVHPSDLPLDKLMGYSDDGTSEIWRFRKGDERAEVKAGQTVTSNSGDFLLSLSRSGSGICVLPGFLVTDALKRGDLVRVLPDWDLPSLWLTLFYPPYEHLPPLVATFSDFFESYARDLDSMVFAGG